jgi:hypothetical protein
MKANRASPVANKHLTIIVIDPNVIGTLAKLHSAGKLCTFEQTYRAVTRIRDEQCVSGFHVSHALWLLKSGDVADNFALI